MPRSLPGFAERQITSITLSSTLLTFLAVAFPLAVLSGAPGPPWQAALQKPQNMASDAASLQASTLSETGDSGRIDVSSMTSSGRTSKSVQRLKPASKLGKAAASSTASSGWPLGSGTALKRLPSVRAAVEGASDDDPALKVIHRLMFGKTAKASQVKAGILKFRGLPLHDSSAFPAGYAEAYDKVLFKVADCKLPLLKQMCDVLAIDRSPKSFADNVADKVNLTQRITDWLESPKEFATAASGTQSEGKASTSTGSTKGLRSKRPRWSGEWLGLDSLPKAQRKSRRRHFNCPQLQTASDAGQESIATRIDSLLAAADPHRVTMPGLLGQLEAEFGTSDLTALVEQRVRHHAALP